MPELPEVEVLVRFLGPALTGQTIQSATVRRLKVVLPDTPRRFVRGVVGARFAGVTRRGKYLLFALRRPGSGEEFTLLGHLGMTGRMYLVARDQPAPKHAAVVLSLGKRQFVYEDTRYFGRLTRDTSALDRLGPEPLGEAFSSAVLARGLARSQQSIKVKLLDQSVVAGLGNIYVSESLYRARISPLAPAGTLRPPEVTRLRRGIREVLERAIQFGSTVPLNWSGQDKVGGLFYYGQSPEAAGLYEERLQVYDRANQPCRRCRAPIQRVVQAARSTYYCPRCQPPPPHTRTVRH